MPEKRPNLILLNTAELAEEENFERLCRVRNLLRHLRPDDLRTIERVADALNNNRTRSTLRKDSTCS